MNQEPPVCTAQPSRDVSELYHELLYAVARKFPGESRHETALRYIRDAEERAKGDEGNGKFSESDLQTIARCYEFYPRHEKPHHAKRAILKALKDPQLKRLAALNGRTPVDELWMRVQEYAVYVDEHKGEFTSNGRSTIPYPATWFNAGSYLVDAVTKRHLLLDKG